MAALSALSRIGFRTALLGSAASLAIAAPLADGDMSQEAHTHATQRIGLYFDRTLNSEKIGFVVMGNDRFAVDTNGVTVNGRATVASATGRLDIQSDRTLAGYAVLTDNVVGIGRQVSVPVNAGDGSFYAGNVVGVTGAAGAASRNVAVGADIAITTNSGGRNVVFGAATSASGSGVLLLGLNRTGIQGNNGIAIVVGGNSTINVQTGILIGSAGGQVGNFGASRVVGLGFSVTANANDAIAIGNQANSSHSKSIALGRLATTTAANQLRIGGSVASTDHLNVSITSNTASVDTLTGALVAVGGIATSDVMWANGFFSNRTLTSWSSLLTPVQTYHRATLANPALQGNFTMDGLRLSMAGSAAQVGDIRGRYDYLTANGGVGSVVSNYLGYDLLIEVSNASAVVTTGYGIRVNLYDSANGVLTNSRGVEIEYVNATTKAGNTNSQAIGLNIDYVETYQADATPATGVAYGIRIGDVYQGCVTGEAYGLYLGSVVSAAGSTSSWGIYHGDGFDARHYFNFGRFVISHSHLDSDNAKPWGRTAIYINGSASDDSGLFYHGTSDERAFGTNYFGDTEVRLQIRDTGVIEWGPGNAAVDVNLYRQAANVLGTDDSLRIAGSIILPGATSGSATISVAATAGTVTLTLPTTNGSAGQALITNGAGVLSWAAFSSPVVIPDQQIVFGTGSSISSDARLTFDYATGVLLCTTVVRSGTGFEVRAGAGGNGYRLYDSTILKWTIHSPGNDFRITHAGATDYLGINESGSVFFGRTGTFNTDLRGKITIANATIASAADAALNVTGGILTQERLWASGGATFVGDPTAPATVREVRTSGRIQAGSYIANNSPYNNLGSGGQNARIAAYESNGANNAVCAILGVTDGTSNTTLKTGIVGIGRRSGSNQSRHIGVWGAADNVHASDPTYVVGVLGSDTPTTLADNIFTSLMSVGVIGRAAQTARTALANIGVLGRAGGVALSFAGVFAGNVFVTDTAISALPTDAATLHVRRNTNAGIRADTFSDTAAAMPGLLLYRARGVDTTPTAVQNGDNLGFVGAYGHDGTAFSATSRASLVFFANQNWTGANQGTRAVLRSTPNNSTTPLDVWEATDSFRVLVAFSTAVITVSSHTVLNNTHQTVLVDASAGPVTITLPAATNGGRRYDVKKIDNSSNVVTIACEVGNTLDGASTIELTVQHQHRSTIADGVSNWFIV